jgi:hypothetical protein
MGLSLINRPVTTTLNASTYTEIRTGTQDCYGFIILISTGYSSTGFYIADNEAGTGAVLIPEGISGIPWTDFVEFDSTVMWCKAASGTPDLILMPGKIPAIL